MLPTVRNPVARAWAFASTSPPPADTPKPAPAAVVGPWGLAFALVPLAPGQLARAKPPPIPVSSCIRLRLRQSAHQGAGRHDLADHGVKRGRGVGNGAPRVPGYLNLRARVGGQEDFARVQKAQFPLGKACLPRN